MFFKRAIRNYRNGTKTLLLCLYALVISVDISPQAADMLLARGQENCDVWISDVYYTWAGGEMLALVKNGVPENPEKYTTVDARGFKVFVPNDFVFSGDIPSIVQFPRKNGNLDVGVSNVVF